MTTKAISDSVNSTAALMIEFPSAAALLFPHSDGILDIPYVSHFPNTRDLVLG
jgi:hypothetical protein